MKRSHGKDSLDSEPETLLTLILTHNDKQLVRHFLSYCYASVNALKRTCTALRNLFDTYQTQVSFWRYGIIRELRLRLREAAWPPAVVDVYCQRFDPFYHEWPEDMPGRPRVPTCQNVLRWLWTTATAAESCKERLFINRYDDGYSITTTVLRGIMQNKRSNHLTQRVLTFTMITREGCPFCIRHAVLRTPIPPGYPENWLAIPFERWEMLPGSLELTCYYRKDKLPVMYTALCVEGREDPQMFWTSQFMEEQDVWFTGYCTPSGGLPP